MKASLGKAAGAMATVVLSVFGGKAAAVEAPQAARAEQIAQRVAAIRAKANEIARQQGGADDSATRGAGREQLADWKKWKND